MADPGTTETPAPPWWRPALALPVGFAGIAVTNAIAIAVVVPWPRGGLPVRLAHHALDAAEVLSIGLCAGAMLAAWLRFVPTPRWATLLAYAAVSTAIQHAVLGQDLLRQATVAAEGRFVTPLFWAFVVLTGLAIPAAHLLGLFFARYRRLVLLPLVLALGGVVTHHAILRDDYPGLHAVIAWASATLGGAALASRAEVRLLRWAARPRARLVAYMTPAVLAVAVIPPSNRMRLELFREPGAIGAWLLATTVWPLPRVAEGAPPASPWFADRSALPPRPPSQPRIAPKQPVVVMVTIDALRADAIEGPENEAALPTITELKRTGAHFLRATSPGAQTAVSLTTVFSGRYFSELRWAMHGQGSARFAYAAADPTPRFPELLGAAGVRTSSFCSLLFLAGEFGVIRGFDEEKMIAVGRRHAAGADMVDAALARLRRAGDEPLFLYVHLMEPHAPYDRGKKQGSDRERYQSEIAVADAQLARLVKLLRQRFKDRAVLVVSADHGEAFGEHGTQHHTKTLYEELLRVPLIVHGPGVVARRIEQHVGLIDLGPTLLDLFGVDTPAHFMGESLVPLLAGRDVRFARPLLAEGRFRRALYDGNLKVIEDTRRKVVEAYDLERDPAELDNLYDEDHLRVEPSVAKLRAFFGVHALSNRDPSYAMPYKP